ncbi:MAG: VUT family protein, partial [Chloroflexi bacterium]|nr:VUT family protein [Chloroflexota bacterium]
WELFLTLTLTNYIFKVGVEALMTPATYAVVRALKKVEQEDYFDRDTNFNPFAIK